jgi:hypothetical protein
MPAPRGVFVPLVLFLVAAAMAAAVLPPGLAAAVPTWAPSSGLVLAEVVTGGASASDEYVEISNAGPTAVDLGDCELIYVTASGATTTRKASFAEPLLLVPGQHLLVANAVGIYGPLADATYSSGLAADGGAVALRRADGTVVDAVGWGTATNTYVEGAVAPAPPAKSSLERLPGGWAGNTQDTNDNRADWFVQSNPIAQSLASEPAPGSSATPSATATPSVTLATTPSPAETDNATPDPTAAATSTSTLGGSLDPSPTPIPSKSPPAEPTATPTAGSTSSAPAPAAPSLTPTPAPTPQPPNGATPSPTVVSPSVSSSPGKPAPDLETIAAARAQLPGARVHVAGVVTAEAGLLGADGLLAVEDSSGGIFVRVSTPADGLTVGRSVEVDGVLAAPYGQLEVRDLVSLTMGEEGADPAAARAELTDIGESTEGSLVAIRGTVDSVTTDSGRLTITIGDGTANVRVLADPPTGLSKSDVTKGDVVLVTGIVGQHATATGRLDGYRLWLRRREDLLVRAPIPTDAPNPGSTPSKTPVYGDLASALGTRGAAVDVEATVTATAGLLDIGNPTIVVDDSTAAVAVILPDSAAVPPVGMRVHVTGKVGRWEGGPTVTASSLSAEGELQALGPRTISGPLDGSLEWQLVRVCGRIDGFTPAGARWRADMLVDGHPVVVLGEPAAAIALTKASVGRLAVATGIVRRSTSDSSVFQLLPRTALDFILGPSPEALGALRAVGSIGSGASRSSGDPSAVSGSSKVEIGLLSAYVGKTVTVAGLVTETASDTATIDDGTGQVRIGSPSAADVLTMLEPGDAIEVTGLVQQDDLGLIIEADPASIVDLPGETAPTADSGLIGLVAGAPTPSTAASEAAAASIRRASPSAPPPNVVALLAVLLMILVVVPGAVILARRGGKLRRLPVASSLLQPANLAQMLPRRLRFGRGKGR